MISGGRIKWIKWVRRSLWNRLLNYSPTTLSLSLHQDLVGLCKKVTEGDYIIITE
jgi:hypothetical protein